MKISTLWKNHLGSLVGLLLCPTLLTACAGGNDPDPKIYTILAVISFAVSVLAAIVMVVVEEQRQQGGIVMVLFLLTSIFLLFFSRGEAKETLSIIAFVVGVVAGITALVQKHASAIIVAMIFLGVALLWLF